MFDIHDVAQTTHCELDWRFSRLLFFSPWGRFFSLQTWRKSKNFFLLDSYWKNEEIDVGVFRYFNPEPSYFIYTVQNWSLFYMSYLSMRTKNQRNKILKKAQRQSLRLSVFYRLISFWAILIDYRELKIFPKAPYRFCYSQSFFSRTENFDWTKSWW